MRPETMKLLVMIFWQDMKLKTKATKTKINKQDYIKLKGF